METFVASFLRQESAYKITATGWYFIYYVIMSQTQSLTLTDERYMDVASVYPAIFQRSSAVFCEKSTESIYVSSSLISCKSLLREAGPPMEGHGGATFPGPPNSRKNGFIGKCAWRGKVGFTCPWADDNFERETFQKENEKKSKWSRRACPSHWRISI